MNVCLYTYTHIYTHLYIHTYIHTYTHIHTYIVARSSLVVSWLGSSFHALIRCHARSAFRSDAEGNDGVDYINGGAAARAVECDLLGSTLGFCMCGGILHDGCNYYALCVGRCGGWRAPAILDTQRQAA